MKCIKLFILITLAVNIPVAIFYPDQTEPKKAIAQTLQDRKEEAERLLDQGLAQGRANQNETSIQTLKKALAIYQSLQDRSGEGLALSGLGIAYNSLSQPQKAINFFQQALPIIQEINLPNLEAELLVELGTAYTNVLEYSQALETFQKALPIYQQLQDPNGVARVLNNLGALSRSVSQYDKAIEFHQKSLLIYQQLQNRDGVAAVLYNLGFTYQLLAELDRATEFYKQALLIYQQLQNPDAEANASLNLGTVYLLQFKNAEATKLYQHALQIFQRIKNSNGEAYALNSLGNMYRVFGQYSEAIKLLNQALLIFRKAQNLDGELKVQTNLGIVYNSQSQYVEAVEVFQNILPVYRKVGDRDGEARVLNGLGYAYRSLAQYSEAIESFQKAATIFGQIKNYNGEAMAWNNLGTVHGNLSQHSKAIEFFQKALPYYQKVGDRLGEGLALHNIGSAYSNLNNPSAAEKALNQAIEIWESQRFGLPDNQQVSLFELQAITYPQQQQVQINLRKFGFALETSERGRARAFVELLSTRLAGANTEKMILQQRAEKPSVRQLRRIAQLQNSTLVQYSFIFNQDLYIWVIQPNAQITFRKVDLTALDTSVEKLVADSRKSIGVTSGIYRQSITLADHPKGEENKQALRKLHQILIDPIADLLPKEPNQRVVFMPQNSLFFVPFPALQDEKGKYLIEKHTILTAPSIQTLQLTRETKLKQKTQSNETALIVGNPTMPQLNGRQLPNLSGAKNEAIAIAKLFNTQALIGGQATEAEVTKRMKTAKYIHLATHGLLDSIKGDVPGAIALAPTPTDNGFLTASEIFDMQLNADLAVLSACDTALGDIKGEGVIGLSRSLISAGVPSVIVSLWQVPDAPTANLMTEFYRNLREKKLDKAQSLRQAMLTTKNRYPNPRNWAAFTLIGEAE